MLEIFLVGVILILVGVIYLLDRRIKIKGALFTAQATPLMRLFALVLGLFFAGLFVVGLTSEGTINFIFPILAVALIGYALGAGQLLNRFQEKGESSHPPPETSTSHEASIKALDQDEMKVFSQNRLLRFFIRWVIILAGSALFLYGAFWAAANPNNPIGLVIVVGIILLVLLSRLLGWFNFLRDLFK